MASAAADPVALSGDTARAAFRDDCLSQRRICVSDEDEAFRGRGARSCEAWESIAISSAG